jgi:hypothetical protein
MSLGRAVELAQERDPNTATVINSDYGAGTQDEPQSREHGPEGFTVVRGDRLDGPANGDTDNNAVRRPWLAVGRDAPLRVELGRLTTDNGSKPDWVYSSIGGGPWLIRNGVIQQEDIRTCKNTPGSCYDGAAQTAAGLSQDQRWLFLVVDERRGELIELAQFIWEQLAAWDAIKFDGGGSSQLWYGGRTITPGDGRQISQYLAVIAEPGAGIQDTVAVPGLSAQATSPLFFDLVLPGETAHLRIEVRNTGQTTWQPGQGIELRRVWKDVVSPVVESYPLLYTVRPGETVAWDVALNTGGSPFTVLRFQMHQGNAPFGPEIGAVVVSLPEELKTQEEKIRRAIEEQLQEWRQQAEQELDQRLEEFQKQLLELIRRELERQARRWIDEICGGSAMLLGGMLLLALRQHQR